LDRDLNSLLRTDINTTTTCPAFFSLDRAIVDHADGVDEAYVISTGSTANAPVGHRHFDAGHLCDLGTDAGCKMRKNPPEATAWATVADGEKLVRRLDFQPDCVKLVAADQANQTNLTTTPDIFQGFPLRCAVPESRINLQRRLSQKETAQIDRVVFALGGTATDAPLHDPMIIRLFDELFHHLGWEDHFAWFSMGLFIWIT